MFAGFFVFSVIICMIINTYSINVVQGDTLNVNLNYTGVDGAIVNLSGYTLNAGLMSRYGSSGYLGTLTPTLVDNGVSGVVNLTMPATGTAALLAQRAVYDIKATSGNTVSKIFGGSFYVYPEVY